MRIVEYIGAEGVISTHRDNFYQRCQTPRAGDGIAVPLGLKYPFNAESYPDNDNPKPFIARISEVQDGKVNICMHASVFWSSDKSVSISGGVWHSLDLDVLKFDRTEKLKFWNFPNGSGGGMGCEYWVQRPVYAFDYENWEK